MNKGKNRLKGCIGENIAKKYLESAGFKILEQNWHYSRYSEIDIIAKDKDTVVFVEVKARSGLDYGHPLESITRAKLKKIYSAALAYLQQTKEPYKNFRIDALSVLGFENPKIEHIQNIAMS